MRIAVDVESVGRTRTTRSGSIVQAAIASALKFGAVPGGVANISEVDYEISLVAQTAGFVITAVTCSAGTVAGSAGNITSNAGCIPVLGTVTFS